MRHSAGLASRDADRGAWFICDVCGQRHRRKNMFVRWDNLRVDWRCNDPRPPQMSPPNVYPEGIPFPDARPPQDNPDRLGDDTFLVATKGGMLATDGGHYFLASGQGLPPGALSPKPILVDNVPKTGPGPNVLTDDITLKVGVVPAPTANPADSPGPIPLSALPKPVFYTPPTYDSQDNSVE